MAKQGEGTAPVAVTKTYDLVMWLLLKVERFPKSHKFTMGDRLANYGLDLQLALVEAAYATKKEDALDFASHRVNGLRYLLRMAKDMKLLTADSYAFAAERLDEVGRMVGGWRKSSGGKS